MLAVRRYRNAESNGYVYPDSGNATPAANVGDIFAPRPFSPHIATTGYDYDFHRGLDIVRAIGDPVYAPCGGTIIRLHRSHFGFETDSQLAYWAEDQDGGVSPATFVRSASNLIITGTRGDVGAFPSVAKYKAAVDRVALATQFEFRVALGTVGVLAAGRFGFAILDEATNEYIGLEWNGTNAYSLGVGSGGPVASHGTSLAVTTEDWLRFALDSGTLTWDVSNDATTWTNIDSEAMPAFTSTRKDFVPLLYWRSTDVGAPAVAISVDAAYWRDDDGIGRFGNWIFLQRASKKFCLVHFRELDVEVGDVVEAGQVLGTAGATGFDSRSGPVLDAHAHLEYIPNASTLYNNDEPTNPLAPGVLPRANVSSNVAVTRSEENDPDGAASWRLRIVVARAANDFDVNEVSLTGNLATRAINFNTRAGLNADNDIPKDAGVYIVPVTFDSSSTEYEMSIYFNKATVGNAFTSAFVKDTEGVTLWSE